MILLVAILSSCAKVNLPLVTLNQIDLVNKKVNSNEITKYNKESCKVEGIKHDPYGLFDIPQGEKVPKMHGAICLSAEDFLKVKTLLETECQNQKNNEIINSIN